MRKIDIRKKGSVEGKAAKTINFDFIVLDKLEKRSKEEGINVSKLVNGIVKKAIMTDDEFYGYMARLYCSMMNHYRALKGDK